MMRKRKAYETNDDLRWLLEDTLDDSSSDSSSDDEAYLHVEKRKFF